MKSLVIITALFISLTASAQSVIPYGKWTGSFYHTMEFTNDRFISEMPTPSGISIITTYDYKITDGHLLATTTDIQLRPQSQEVVDGLNENELCGIANWQDNIPTSIGNCWADTDDDENVLYIGYKLDSLIKFTGGNTLQFQICEECPADTYERINQ